MRAIVWAVVGLVMIAGCAENEPEPTTDAEPESGTDIAQNSTLDAIPTALLTLDVMNGTAPLLVNFTIEGDNATEWALDLGDGNLTNGTDFPAMVNHTFSEGAFNVSLLVTGDGGIAYHNATINVTAVEAVVEVLEPFSQTVSVDQPCSGCKQGTLTCTWRAHGNGAAQDCAWIEFGPDYAGQPFSITGTGLDPDGLFWESCDSGPMDRYSNDLTDEAGTIPSGATCILVWEAFDPIVDVTFEITPE